MNQLNPFRRPQRNSAAAETLKAIVREAAQLNETDIVSVNEIMCADPACAGPETIVLIMREGMPTQALKFLKPLNEVSKEDVCSGSNATVPSS
jgi:hypothetical protein